MCVCVFLRTSIGDPFAVCPPPHRIHSLKSFDLFPPPLTVTFPPALSPYITLTIPCVLFPPPHHSVELKRRKEYGSGPGRPCSKREENETRGRVTSNKHERNRRKWCVACLRHEGVDKRNRYAHFQSLFASSLLRELKLYKINNTCCKYLYITIP